MHQIVILGAGKSASVLIEFLLQNSLENDLFLHVADVNLELVLQKTKGHIRSQAHPISTQSKDDLTSLIEKGDIIISMLPPSLHVDVAKICLAKRKHFLNASYLTDDIRILDEDVKISGLTFLLEMGLDPGIDHMSAMEMIDNVKKQSGKIISFFSHCGGLVAPESDNNPWHYKISWNPKNVVLSGKDGAHYINEGKTIFIPYDKLFNPKQIVQIPGHGNFAWYPNRNSIPYLELYGLNNSKNFVRTTLRHPEFIGGWKKLVDWKMTSESILFENEVKNSHDFFLKHISKFGNLSDLNDPHLKLMMEFLGMNQHIDFPDDCCNPSQMLQHLLEKKLALEAYDKDMVVMMHEMHYQLNGKNNYKKSYLVIKGEDQIHTAMAKTVGLPLAMTVIQILKGTIKRKGVFIPIYPDIYIPVLASLKENGIVFEDFTI